MQKSDSEIKSVFSMEMLRQRGSYAEKETETVQAFFLLLLRHGFHAK
jgi:hypothetical protein